VIGWGWGCGWLNGFGDPWCWENMRRMLDRAFGFGVYLSRGRVGAKVWVSRVSVGDCVYQNGDEEIVRGWFDIKSANPIRKSHSARYGEG
jgi:hypothetical protein